MTHYTHRHICSTDSGGPIRNQEPLILTWHTIHSTKHTCSPFTHRQREVDKHTSAVKAVYTKMFSFTKRNRFCLFLCRTSCLCPSVSTLPCPTVPNLCFPPWWWPNPSHLCLVKSFYLAPPFLSCCDNIPVTWLFSLTPYYWPGCRFTRPRQMFLMFLHL